MVNVMSAKGGKIMLAVLLLALVLSGCSIQSKGPKNLDQEQAKAKAIEFINNNLMQPGKTVSIKEIVLENGLYKLTVDLGQGQEVVSYLTRDGAKFFPQVMDVAEVEKETQDRQGQADRAADSQAQNAPKSDKPAVELFVMSHCPFGTQIEKGMLPVVDALGSKIDFKLKFVDYAMHGEKEVTEQLKQVCISNEQPDKLNPYLYCFLKAGDSDACTKEAGLNESKLKSCMSATDKKYQIYSKLNDKSKWSSGSFPPFDVYKDENVKYGVQGSPTLVINGQQIETSRDSASLLKTVCAAFNNAPEECNKELSSATPSSGFGTGTGGSDGGACN